MLLFTICALDPCAFVLRKIGWSIGVHVDDVIGCGNEIFRQNLDDSAHWEHGMLAIFGSRAVKFRRCQTSISLNKLMCLSVS